MEKQKKSDRFRSLFIGSSNRPAYLVGIPQLGVPLHLVGAAYADRLCVTPNHLSAVVRQQSGQTVMQLLNAHTVLQAKVMLRHSSLPIADISDQLGFENPPSFTRFFRRETGTTPSEYRTTPA